MIEKDVKWGAVISYILIIINAVYGLVMIPYVISNVGEIEYGVYKTISSLSSSLMVLDLGLGGTVTRYIAKYKSENQKSKIENFISMILAESVLIIGVILIVCVVLFTGIPTIYGVGFSQDELNLAKQLFVVLSGSLMLHIVENVFHGIITGHNQFAFGNGMKLARILLRMLLISIVLPVIPSSLVLVLIDLILTVALLLCEYVYIRKKIHVNMRISFRNWDKKILEESLKYTMFLFITSIVAQVNNNLDNVVIGAMIGPSAVTVYSIGLLLFGMFEHLSTAISGVMLPTVTNVLKEDDGNIKIQETIVSVGRIQFILLGAALVGFAIIGNEFVSLWLGNKGYEDVYVITLILMIPAMLELCVNVCLSVLRAKNMLGFRTMVLTIFTVINLIITMVGVKKFGYIAAAAGTAFSFLIGSVIIMNLYYIKKLNFNMARIYKNIFDRIWICLIISGAALKIVSEYIGGSWGAFIVKVMIFGVIYAGCLILIGFTKQEKQTFRFVKKIYRK